MPTLKLSVSSRFVLVLVIGFFFQACICVTSLPILKQSLMGDRAAEVKHVVETAYSIVDFYYGQVRRGRLTDGAARSAARNAVRAMRYDGGNYLFIWTLDGTGVVHGAHPEWEGKRFIDSPAARQFPGVATMVSRLIEVAKSPAGEGMSTYRIPKPGATIPIDKITYSRLFRPWGWSIGTGSYVDDINATFRSRVVALLWLFAGLIGVAGYLTFVLGSNLATALTRLSERVVSVARGEFDGDVPEIERTDEVGVMARALLVLRDNSREAVALTLDGLTGLPNRKLLIDRLKVALAASARSGNHGGLMFIDLDKFKLLNDTQGHDAGDMLLRQVADRLRSAVRESDTVARLGGDEFVIVLTDIGHNASDAASFLESVGAQILAVLNEPFHIGNITHITTGSIGLALFADNEHSVEDILKHADLAMYKAKEAGRNACRFFDPQMEAVVRARVALEADLLEAIARNQFELYFQAQVRGDGTLTGAEALIRWNHPVRGMVPPVEFIPFAEETGLILPLGRWVLDSACRQLVRWAADPRTAELKLAVNVSSRQLQQPEFVDDLVHLLRSTGADPNRLELELTESVLVQDVDAVIEKMLALRSIGVRFSLDDFGTGYSSLFYLKRMPLDALKVDQTFVRDLLVDPSDAAIARTIVALAQSLALGVIAEGVESTEQRDLLVRFGCNDFQGYLFSRPLPATAFVDFVQRAAERTRQASFGVAREPELQPVAGTP